MAIILAILRTILTIILILLAFILITVLLILFVPFRYNVRGVKEPGQIEADASVTWLLRMLVVEVCYNISSGKGLTKDIRIFGISLFKVRKWLTDRKKSKIEKEREKRRQEKKKKLERIRKEDPERYERLRSEALARKEAERKKQAKAEQMHRAMEAKQREADQERSSEADTHTKEDENSIGKEKAQPKDDGTVQKEKDTNHPEENEQFTETDGSHSGGNGNQPEDGNRHEDVENKLIRAKRLQRYSSEISSVIYRILAKIVGLILRIIQFIWTLPGKIIRALANIFRKIESTFVKISNLRRKADKIIALLSDEHTHEILRLFKKQTFRLFRHILPRQFTGYVNFGLGDPCMTGKILAAACAFYPLYGRTFRLEPDFEELVFNCRTELKGRIYLFYLGFLAIITYFNKNTKYLIHYVKTFNKEDTE